MKRKNSNLIIYTLFISLILITFFLIFFFFPNVENTPKTGKLSQQEPYYNDLARFLAGMPVSKDGMFYKQTQNKSYVSHTKLMNKFWKKVKAGTIEKIKPWEIRHIPKKFSEKAVFYPLSGADFLNMYNIYPDARQYLMVALEPSGEIPNLLKLSFNRLQKGLASVRRVVRLYGEMNYFQSVTLSKEMYNLNIKGTSPVILFFMARSGLKILNIEKVAVNNRGQLLISDKNGRINGEKPVITISWQGRHIPCAGIRITFQVPGDSATRSLTYLSMSLSNYVVSAKSGIGKYLDSLGDFRTIMKSAVYLLHFRKYVGLKNWLLKKSVMIVQDDSGVPYNDLKRGKWDIKLFGIYHWIPIKGGVAFKQKQLRKDYNNTTLKPLPFRFGYGTLHKNKMNKSNLLVAIKKS